MWNPNIILTVKNRYQNIITLKQGLTQLINEFQQLMRFQLNPQEENEPTLPEYCIVEGPSIITKLRVVVDESKNSMIGNFLNSSKMVAPTLKERLISILIQFRFQKAACFARIIRLFRPHSTKTQKIFRDFSVGIL